MEESIDQFETNVGPPKRPVFLLVISIISFVGIGLSIFYNLWMYAFINSSGINRWSEDLDRYAAYGVGMAILSNIICLVGVLLMFNLRKAGYFIYIGGQLIGMFMKIYTENKLYDLDNSFGVMNIVIFVVLFPAAFIVMYGVNYKALVK